MTDVVNPVGKQPKKKKAQVSSYDIDATLMMIDLVLSGVVAGKLAYEDKKLDFSDLQYLPPVIAGAGPVMGKINELIPEITDIDSEEGKKIMAHVGMRLPGLVGDDLLRKVNAILKVVVSLAEAYGAFKGVQVSFEN